MDASEKKLITQYHVDKLSVQQPERSTLKVSISSNERVASASLHLNDNNAQLDFQVPNVHVFTSVFIILIGNKVANRPERTVWNSSHS